nr:MATE family efflux transporter [Paenibacillus sambharensis]
MIKVKKITANWGLILSLALPSVISFAMITLSGTLNLIIIGKLGAEAIAIVGVANIVIYNAWAIFSGIGHSVNYLVAQNFGAGDMKRGIERTYVALYVTSIVAVLIFLAGAFLSGEILRLIGGENSQGLLAGEEYLQIRFYAMACGILNFVFHGFFRGIGDTRTPMVLSLISNILMVFFTYAWTYGHFGFQAYGLTGAGWAFFLGEAVGLLGCLYVYFIRLHPVYGTRSKIAWNRSEARLILQESGKLGVQEFSLSFSMLLFTMFVAVLGEVALAANEVALSVMGLGFMPAFAFGSTATILVGQRIGQRKPFEGRRLATDTAVVGTLLLIIIGVVEFFFAEPIARIYTPDPEVYQLAGQLIMISAFLQLFDGLLNIYAGGLRGTGDTRFLLIISFVLGLFVFVPTAYLAIFIFKWGSIGAWVALYSYLVLFGLAVTIRFYRTNWSTVTIRES